ncbi:MAG: CRISPR-associated ring nuclease Crn3/Csx3 [Thermosediminibacteraceae bacterium]|nr:CRISPR-associated ring nuclease Crn3/Csx3 [Thermosediminibacteraceae bacterium]
MVEFSTIECKEYTVVHFKLDEPINPEDLAKLNPPKVNCTKGIIISGRGPIWLYCYLVHYYHMTKFVATYDPRFGGAVVVESHIPSFKPGDIIEIGETESMDLI